MNQNALIRWASGIVGRKFAWGETDCVTIALRGLEIAGAYGNTSLQWSTRREAWRTYKYYGSVSGFLCRNGWRMIHKNYAGTGDVIVLKTRPMETACLVINDRVLIIDPQNGVCTRKTGEIREDYICFRYTPLSPPVVVERRASSLYIEKQKVVKRRASSLYIEKQKE